MKGRDNFFSGTEYHYFVIFRCCFLSLTLFAMNSTAMTMMLVGYARRGREVLKMMRISGMKMTKKILRCKGEGERKGAVRWERVNRRKRAEKCSFYERKKCFFVVC